MLATLLLALTAFAPGQNQDQEDAKVLEKINSYRKLAGLKPVAVDPAFSKGCLAHAQYLIKNAEHPSVKSLGTHSEDPKLPGYTEEGAKAAKSSVITPTKDLSAAVDWSMASLFHRLIVLDPRVTRIGFGFAKTGDSGIAVIHLPRSIFGTTTKPPTFPPVLYPGDQQKDVPLQLGFEFPNPVPESKDGKAGYPITVAFPPKVPITNVTASLKDGAGQEVALWLSTPEKPAGGQTVFQQNSISLIAQAPLKPGTAYTVNIQAKINNTEWKKTWSFTTGKE
jgi:hypothetical protein